MITDKEIEKIIKWADENNIVGKRWKNVKWGINLSSDETNSVKRGIPRDKETLLEITHLNLSKFRLDNIPSEIFKLAKLVYLDISNNNLTSLLDDIKNLKNLEYLDLSNNWFWNENDEYSSFHISKEIINLKKLKYLNVGELKFKKFPEYIFDLNSLERLILGSYHSKFSLSKNIGKLTNLIDLRLNYLDNKKLPIEISKLKKLKYLDIIDCDNLKSLSNIENLKELKGLIVSSCEEISDISKNIENLINLKFLTINYCYSLKTISKEIGNLTQLQKLDLSYNYNLTDIPKEIGNLTQLKELDLRDINIEKLPDELSQLTNLEKLNGEPYIKIKNEERKNNKSIEVYRDLLEKLREVSGTQKVAILRKIQIYKESLTFEEKGTIQKEINLLFSLLNSSKNKLYSIFSKKEFGNRTFPHKNLLLKGVTGTGKSRAIENIINDKLQLKDHKQNILRINIHSASSNADLMQGIGISSTNGKIEYKEKQGIILNFIEKATFNPNQPFVLILEEIQENSLNELIGDLIYLIEDDKRAKGYEPDDEVYGYQELVEKIIANNPETAYVEVPYLVNSSTNYKKMIMPNNLYIFCTSNYRDDKKVIEDNLLRRFEVIEIYPNSQVVNEYIKEFFITLNNSILEVMTKNYETHPDRFLIGHSNWLKVETKEEFYRAFSKLITEFKDIREIEFNIFKEILEKCKMPDKVDIDIKSYKSYFELIKDIQTKINYDFIY